jgi:hypothetical protein
VDKRERQQFARIERCLIAMCDLGPSNPANLAAITQAWHQSRDVAGSLWRAIEGIGYGEWAEADEHIADAERVLKPASRAAETRAN